LNIPATVDVSCTSRGGKWEIVAGGAVTVVVAVWVEVVPGPVTVWVEVVPGPVTVWVADTVLTAVAVEVFVVFGLMSKSPPKPNPTPITPAAARAPLHFSTFLLETAFLLTFSLESDKIIRLLKSNQMQGNIGLMKVETVHERSVCVTQCK
jgi:hypothetical protein